MESFNENGTEEVIKNNDFRKVNNHSIEEKLNEIDVTSPFKVTDQTKNKTIGEITY